MKKLLLSITVALLAATGASAQIRIHTTGVATQTDSTGKRDTISVTPCDTTYVAGAAWADTKQALDFTHCFTLKFKASFDVVYGGGGDGICVVWGTNITTTTLPNGTGGYLGYYDSNPAAPNPDYVNSIAVEIDNFNDCPYAILNDCPLSLGDHTQMSKNASAIPAMAGPVSTDPTGALSIKDGHFHDYEVQWVPASMGGPLLTFSRDGITRFTSTAHLAAFFTTPTAVPWGFTGGAAAACSHQLITGIEVTKKCGGIDSSKCDDKCYWRLTGNNTTPTDFIGTTNAEPFRIATNNTQRAIVATQGEIGFHIPAPTTTVDVDGTPIYSGSPSGVRLRHLPKGKGHPLVVDAQGYVFIGEFPKCCDDVKDTDKTDDTSRVVLNRQAQEISTLQAQLNDMKQQMEELKTLFNAATGAAGSSLHVSPNPTSGQMTATYSIANPYVSAVLTITDVAGRTVLSTQVMGSSGEQKMSMPQGTTSGQFVISLVVDGKVTAIQKLILLNK